MDLDRQADITLFTRPSPYGSCLQQQQPDLARVLNLLLVANKYDAPAIGDRALALVTAGLQKNNTVDVMVSPIRLVEVGTTIGSQDLESTGWDLTMKELKEGVYPLAYVLDLAERMETRRYMAETYYQGMLQGYQVWSVDIRLKPVQKRNLLNGTRKCIDAMDDAVTAFRSPAEHACPDSPELCSCNIMGYPSVGFAVSALLSCDILSRLRIISTAAVREDVGGARAQCLKQLRAIASSQLESVESNLLSYFIAEDPELSQARWTMLAPSPPPTPRPPPALPVSRTPSPA